MALKRSIESFLDSDDDSDTNSPPKKRKLLKPTTAPVHIIHMGPFNLSTSEVNLRKFVFLNNRVMPSDIVIEIRNKHVFGFIGYKTLSEAQQTVLKLNSSDTNTHYHMRHRPKRVCELISTDYNKYSQLLYDRSSFSNATQWIQLFGLKATQPMDNTEAKQWITRLLNWEFKQKSFDILKIKIVHNVRYPTMSGFALIQLENSEITHQLVTHFQNKWRNDPQFSYWMDHVDPNRNAFIRNSDVSDIETHTKQLIFSNLHWKTTKSMLQKHIQTLLHLKQAKWNQGSIDNITVHATATGYPLGTAVITCKAVKDAELVQSVCHASELLNETVFVRFYAEEQCVTKEKVHKKVRFDVEKSESEIDSDGEDIVEMASSSDDSEDDDGSEMDSDIIDGTESDEDNEDSDDSEGSDDDDAGRTSQSNKKKRFPLTDKELLGLWKWNNPNRNCPKGLLSQARYIGGYKKNWKELKRKDWLKEWNKKERISGKDKYWIRSGKLIPASQRWRDRYKKKTRNKM